MESSLARALEQFADALPAIADSIPGGFSERIDGLALMRTGVPHLAANQCVILSPRPDPDDTIRHITTVFGDLPHMVQTWHAADMDDALRAHGFTDAATLPMMLHPGAVTSATTPDGITVRAPTPDEVTTASTVAAQCLDVPQEAMDTFMAPWMLEDPSFQMVVAIDRERIVGTALGLTRDGMSAVFNVATLPGYRRRGIGEAVTRAVMKGPDASFLQASALGQPVYERMGFQHVGAFTGWVRS